MATHWQPTPVFLPGESQGQRSLAGYSPPATVAKSQRQPSTAGMQARPLSTPH